MTGTTDNRKYNIPEEGESNWHEPVNENWQNIDQDIHELYQQVGSSDDSEDGTSAVVPTRTNVGALTAGGYHSNGYSDGGYGVVFSASDLYIDSVIVDSDLSGISNPDLTVELRRFQDGSDNPTVVDSTTVTLEGGPERISLGFTVPESGTTAADPNDEYVLQRGEPNGNAIPLRRRYEGDGDWSTADFEDETYTDPDIDFIEGALNATSASGSPPVGSWYYFFDWLVGPEKNRLMAPWSSDVDEIYMRPRDPEEEFDDVSPRALWIDTS